MTSTTREENARCAAALTAAVEAVAKLHDVLPHGFNATDVLAATRVEGHPIHGRFAVAAAAFRALAVCEPVEAAALAGLDDFAAMLSLRADDALAVLRGEGPREAIEAALKARIAEHERERDRTLTETAKAEAESKRLEAEYQRVLQAVWRHPNLAEKAITDRNNRVVGHHIWVARR